MIRVYTPLDATQACEWRLANKPPPTRYHSELRDWARMLIVAVRQDKIIAWEFLDEGETLTAQRYVKFLNESIRPYIEENYRYNEYVVIEHDNARPHTATYTQNYIQSQRWRRTRHPYYS